VRLKTLARRAGIGHVQTHDFRRTVATSLLRKHDAAIVAKLLGHSSLAATLTYDLSGQDEQRWAISTLPLPECAVEPELEGESEDGHG
jgi:integrase